MASFRLLRRPLVIVAVVLLVDVLGRIPLGFQIKRVNLLESVLFAAACLLLVWSAERDRLWSTTVQRIDLWLALAFGLGSARAALWFAGLPVSMANIVVLGLGVLLGLGNLMRRRIARRSRDRPTSDVR
jgi:hypothetical protein